jgi:alpha-D-ribose 1-methylphosphonate 5-triphosphate synthase subunit PhnL
MSMPILRLSNVSKRFTLHNQRGVELNVLENANLTVDAGECVVLGGPSGMGKSTVLKLIYANYRASAGSIRVLNHSGNYVEVTSATPQTLVRLRSETIGYVSQFLRVIPRVCALDVVAEPLITHATNDAKSLERAREAARCLLTRLRIPDRLWHLPPSTFSGGEQQRINIARNLIKHKPLLLVDEPTASLDADNTATVAAMLDEARARGSAIVGIFHDASVSEAVATRRVDVASFRGDQ